MTPEAGTPVFHEVPPDLVILLDLTPWLIMVRPFNTICIIEYLLRVNLLKRVRTLLWNLRCRMYQPRAYVSIPLDRVKSMVGKLVHISWATGRYHGCVWILEKVEGNKAYLRTPKTGKRSIAIINELCYTRQHEPK